MDSPDRAAAPSSRRGESSFAASVHEQQGEWLVVTSYGQKVVTSYDTREEAEAAVEWLRKTYPNGPLVEFCHA